MFDDELDYGLEALEELLDETGTPIEETPMMPSRSDDFVELTDPSKIDEPSKESLNVTDLVAKARERMDSKYHSVAEAESALNAVLKQVKLTNTALLAMANCSKRYNAGLIDKEEHNSTIRDTMEELRIPVKELQLQLGRTTDKDTPPTESELEDFRDYLEGLVKAFRDHIACLSKSGDLSAGSAEESTYEDDEDDNPVDECNECNECNECEECEETTFSLACESLMIHIENDTSFDDEDSAIESVLDSFF